MDNPFCPQCDTNIGVGTYDAIGCPVCGAEPDDEHASTDAQNGEPASTEE